jgi:hypothetical protein
MVLVTVGLDPHLIAILRTRLDLPIRACAMPPRFQVRGGRTKVESARVEGRFDEVSGVVWHGYFDDAVPTRRALAISSTPSFPDLRMTLPHDDRLLSLALATRADGVEVPRSVLGAGDVFEADAMTVAKWGDRHCGEGKARFVGRFEADAATVLEPFLEGSSERVLLVGNAAWHLRYESDDWRKNVRAKVSLIAPDAALIARARKIAAALSLPIAGIDFLVHARGATLLEVNAYPGLEDAPDAEATFIEEIVRWASSLP